MVQDAGYQMNDTLIFTRAKILTECTNLVGGKDWNVSWDQISKIVILQCLQGAGVTNFASITKSSRDESVCRVADALYMVLEVMDSGVQVTRHDHVDGGFYFRIKSTRVLTEKDLKFAKGVYGL
jgi:hypothetical protein